jgi:hypothetical protein
MGFAIRPADGRTRWLYPSYRSRTQSHPRQVLAAQHLFIPLPAVNHRRRAAARRTQIAAPLRRHQRVDQGLFGRAVLCEHHAIIGAGTGERNPALDHVAQDQIGFALQRIAPAAAACRHHLHHLSLQHRLAVDQAAELACGAFGIDGDTERQTGLAAIEAVTAEPHPVRGHDGTAIDQRAVVLFIALAAAAESGAA